MSMSGDNEVVRSDEVYYLLKKSLHWPRALAGAEMYKSLGNLQLWNVITIDFFRHPLSSVQVCIFFFSLRRYRRFFKAVFFKIHYNGLFPK